MMKLWVVRGITSGTEDSRTNSDGRQSTFGVDFSFNWRRLHWTSSSSHSFQLTFNSAGSGRWMLNVRQVASYSFNVKVVQELFRSKITSTAADQRSEGAVCYHLSRTSLPSKRRSNLLEKHYDRWGNLGLWIWQVRKPGFTDMTGEETWVYGCDFEMKRHSSQRVSKISREPKRHPKFSRTLRLYW
jgi:hypothetical protein